MGEKKTVYFLFDSIEFPLETNIYIYNKYILDIYLIYGI